MFIQLNPPIPINIVASEDWKGPTGSGLAIFHKDFGVEFNNIWTTIMDETGEIWDIPNSFVRAKKNITLGRNLEN